MTPQQEAMNKLLQISLFKLADQFHETLDDLKERHPDQIERLEEIGRDVEKMVDATLEDYGNRGGDFSFKIIEDIHTRIIEARNLLDK